MGLDIYFHERMKGETDNENAVNIAYWRKHNRLMDAMAQIYGEEIENCEDYQVTGDVLDQLEARIKDPETELGDNVAGFFWGGDYEYDEDLQKEDLEAVAKAREVLARGNEVIFHAWW